MEDVRRVFRGNDRARERSRNRRRGRGRSPSPAWKTRFFLLNNDSYAFLPPPAEMQRLTRNGLGTPRSGHPGPGDLTETESKLRLTWTGEEVEDFICNLYPDIRQLSRYGFKLAKCTKGRLLQHLNQPMETAKNLKKFVGKGRVYILPNRPITDKGPTLPVPHVESEEDDSSDDDLNDFLSAGTPTVLFRVGAGRLEEDTLAARHISRPVNPAETAVEGRRRTRPGASTEAHPPPSQRSTTAAQGTQSRPGVTEAQQPPHGAVQGRRSRSGATEAQQTPSTAVQVTRPGAAEARQPRSGAVQVTRPTPEATEAQQTPSTAVQVTRPGAAEARQPRSEAVQVTRPTPEATEAQETPSGAVQVTRPGAAEARQPRSRAVQVTRPTPTATEAQQASSGTVQVTRPGAADDAQPPQEERSAAMQRTIFRPGANDDAQPPTAAEDLVNVDLEADIAAAHDALKECISGEQVSITVTRGEQLQDNLLELYKDRYLLNNPLHVHFEGENGDDFGGLTSELFMTFWSSVSKLLFKGEHNVVPDLPLHRMRKESWKFVSVGKILAHTAALTQTIPSILARSIIIKMVFDSRVDDDCLMEDLLLFVTDHEKRLLEAALFNFDSLTTGDLNRLESFYASYALYDKPRKDDVKFQLLAIANRELLDNPGPLIKLMRQGIPQNHLEAFWQHLSLSHLTLIHKKQRPTPEKVVNVIQLPTDGYITTADEERVLYYLKEFLSTLDSEALTDFLNLATSSIHQPSRITVSFNKLVGLMRRPKFHTCSNVIEIPTTYHSFQEFRREFRSILSCPEAFCFSAV